MDNNAKTALGAVENLIDLPEEQLYRMLGACLTRVGNDARGSDQFDLDVPLPPPVMGAKDVLMDFGRSFFNRVEKQAFTLLCGTDPEHQKERDKVSEMFRLGKSDVAAGISALLVAQLALAPAIAAMVAALVVKLLFQPALDTTCDAWRNRVMPVAPTPAPAPAGH